MRATLTNNGGIAVYLDSHGDELAETRDSRGRRLVWDDGQRACWAFSREIDARRFAKKKGITIVEPEEAS